MLRELYTGTDLTLLYYRQRYKRYLYPSPRARILCSYILIGTVLLSFVFLVFFPSFFCRCFFFSFFLSYSRSYGNPFSPSLRPSFIGSMEARILSCPQVTDRSTYARLRESPLRDTNCYKQYQLRIDDALENERTKVIRSASYWTRRSLCGTQSPDTNLFSFLFDAFFIHPYPIGR